MLDLPLYYLLNLLLTFSCAMMDDVLFFLFWVISGNVYSIVNDHHENGFIRDLSERWDQEKGLRQHKFSPHE